MLQDAREYEPRLAKITLEELIYAQEHEKCCYDICRCLNGVERLSFAYDENGLLIQKSTTTPKIIINYSLKQRVLALSNYFVTSGHPVGRKLYCRTKKYFTSPLSPWTAMKNYKTALKVPRTALSYVVRSDPWSYYPATTALESFVINILGALIHTHVHDRYILVIMDRCTKLVKAIPMKRVPAVEVRKAFVDH